MTFSSIKTRAQENFVIKYFIIGIVGGILLGWWLQSDKTATISSAAAYIVTTGDIQNTIESYGTIALVDEQKIRFNQQGDVTAVYFKKGDVVKKGDIIAELDKSSLESNILQAQINLQNANLQLDETINGDRTAQILQAQNNLEQSKLKLDVVQQEYDNLVEDQNNSGTISDTETTMANARLSIQNYILEGGKILEQIDKILGDYGYQQYIGGQNLSFKVVAQNAYATANEELASVKSYFATGLTSTDDKEKLLIGLNKTRQFYQAVYATTINTYTALQNSSYGEYFTPTMVTNFEDQVYANSTKTKTSLENISNTINQITKLSSTDDDKITLQSKANELTNLKNTIIIQEKTLETTKNGTTQQQLQIAQNGIRQKELALEQTRKDLENLQIIAPFDGTLRKIDFKVGDKVTSSDEKYIYLENPNLVEVSISLDQIDVVHVKAGMKVEVELDAYPNEIFEGVLGDIDSTPTTNNGVVSYTVKVAIDKGEKIMYSGMTASVKIIVENIKNIVIIPTTYIQSIGDTKYVLDKNNKHRDIVVGATDGNMTEIVSGLSIGENIIKGTITSSTKTSKSSSLIPPMNGMGGSMGGGQR